MSGAELALGVVGAVAAIDVAIKACKTVIETCATINNAETQIHERSTRLRSNCLQIITQLEIFRQLEDQLDEQVRSVQTDVLDILVMKLSFADAKLIRLLKSQSESNSIRERLLPKRARVNFALQKTSLDEAINDVESWQRLSFNPLWFAATKAQTQAIDKALNHAKGSSHDQGKNLIRKTIAVRDPMRTVNAAEKFKFLSTKELDTAERIEIAFSSVMLVLIDNKWRLLDSVSDLSKETVRELAVRLKSADPSTFGLLTCLGAAHHETKNAFSIVFRMPDSMSRPETLRAKLMAINHTHSLSDRFRVATQLARAVSSVHTFDMVHKSIRPESIILFEDSRSNLGSAFLFGFGSVRRDDEGTRLFGDTDWAKNIYRHPQRQGAKLQDRYIMQHDIYSLGVCLLEIGLWSSFVEYTEDRRPIRSQTYTLCDGDIMSSSDPGHPELVKTRLLSLATTELPGKMGTKYAKIVESCLTCLDLGNEDFEEAELQDDDGMIAVRYIEKVLMQLGDISV